MQEPVFKHPKAGEKTLVRTALKKHTAPLKAPEHIIQNKEKPLKERPQKEMRTANLSGPL